MKQLSVDKRIYWCRVFCTIGIFECYQMQVFHSASRESKLRTFQGFSGTKLDVWRTFMENATIQVCSKYITWMKKLVQTVQKSPFYWIEWFFFSLWMKLAKHINLSTQTAYKTHPISFDIQTFIYHSKQIRTFPGPFEKTIETNYFSYT